MNLNEKTLKNIIKEVVTENKKSSILLDSPLMEGHGRGQKPGKFKRVMQIIGPSEESKSGFGIMSAHNPLGQQSSSFDNDKRMEQIKALLKEAGKEYEEIDGRFFNNDEKSLVIPDVDIRQMADWSSNSDWPQHSFIFGKKDKLGDDVHVNYYFVELQYGDSYEMAGYKVTDHRTSVFANAEIQKRTDMFSQAGGKKFYIPFFDSSPMIGGEPQVVPSGSPPNPTNP